MFAAGSRQARGSNLQSDFGLPLQERSQLPAFVPLSRRLLRFRKSGTLPGVLCALPAWPATTSTLRHLLPRALHFPSHLIVLAESSFRQAGQSELRLSTTLQNPPNPRQCHYHARDRLAHQISHFLKRVTFVVTQAQQSL